MARPRRTAVKVTYGYNAAITESGKGDDTLITPETAAKEKKKQSKTTTKKSSESYSEKALKLMEQKSTKNMKFARE